MPDGHIYTEHLPPEDFQPKDVTYIDVFELLSLYEGLAWRAPTIVVGPKGIGKTLSIQAYASKVKSPIITFDCSEDVRRSHLLGMQILRGNESPFILGPLTTAFEIANEAGSCILALEEINALSPQIQKVLNAPADWRQRIEVPEAKRVFRLKAGAKLWITGTMNTAVYGGVYQLNEDLKSRFRLIGIGYPRPAAEKSIVQSALQVKLNESIINKVITLADETRQGTLDYALSTRDVMQLLEDISILGTENAMRVVLGKFEESDQDTIVARIRAIFGIDLSKKRIRVARAVVPEEDEDEAGV